MNELLLVALVMVGAYSADGTGMVYVYYCREATLECMVDETILTTFENQGSARLGYSVALSGYNGIIGQNYWDSEDYTDQGAMYSMYVTHSDMLRYEVPSLVLCTFLYLLPLVLCFD